MLPLWGSGLRPTGSEKRRNLLSGSKEGILDIKESNFTKPEDAHASLVPGVCDSFSCEAPRAGLAGGLTFKQVISG